MRIVFFRPVLYSIAFIFSLPAYAQDLQWGLKAGVSLPNLSAPRNGSDVSKGYRTISGPDIEGFANITVAPGYRLEAGIEWSTQGGQKSGLQTIPASPELAQYFPPGTDAQYLYARFTSTVRLQYLMLPVTFTYDFDLDRTDHWKIYFGAGIFGGYLVRARASAAGSSAVYYDPAEMQAVAPVTVRFDSTGDIRDQLHKFNFGLSGIFGLRYRMNDLSVMVEAGGNYGLVDLQKDSQNGTNHTGALVFRIGFEYRMKRRT